ncbi:MAG: flagellar basal-body MS-ring/collar protein FliF [Pseudomonadota bacterium]
MTQIAALWNGLDGRRRFAAALAALAAVIGVLAIARMASQPPMALLYAGLDPAAAGGVVSALETRQSPYEVRGDAIYVPESQRDALRMALAAEGRPESGAAGYEVLDGLSGFGTTAQMFDAAYWRAKEGELARTILALPQVRRARVHIANPQRRPFERGSEPTASVAVSVSAGAIAPSQARAIRFLVASSVSGLSAENVTVVDAENGVAVVDPEAQGAIADGADRASELKASVERLLTARVGADAVIVEVMVDADMNSETVRERLLDPDGRVAIHSDNTEATEQARGGEGAAVTVASNLPDGDVNNGGGGSTRSSSETRQRVNYEVSEVLTERVRRPGEVRRLTVAVLVDGLRTPGADGAPVWTPRPQEELDALRELVESAVGYDAGRGDEITIRTLEFTRPPELGVEARSGGSGFFERNAMGLIQLGVLSAVTLAIALLVLRPMIAARRDAMAIEDEEELATVAELGPPSELEMTMAAAEDVIDAEAVEADRLALLQGAVADRPEDAAALLAAWLDMDDERREPA